VTPPAAPRDAPPPAEPLRWPAEAVWEAVEPLLPGFSVEVLPEIDSTNTELMRRARAGRPDPVLLVAERQRAGRGRLGRIWQSGTGAADYAGAPPAPVGASLTFSFGLPLAPAGWAGLSLAAGVAVAGALHPEIGLKWPNDLWWRDRKLAGILVETAGLAAPEPGVPGAAALPAGARYLVVGVGINVAPRAAAGLEAPPAALQDLLPGIDAPAALLRVARPLAEALQAFAAAGWGAFADAFAARDVLRGRPVVLSDGAHGMALGVADDGALLLRGDDGTVRPVSSGEVSVRPTDRRAG
jgi:BirA family biotin operon repressor/biotin-[acetyl-CoA-carboxylase] ligase